MDKPYSLLQVAAQKFPTAPALISPTETLTYQQVSTVCANLRRAFAQHNITSGQRVVILSNNSTPMFITLHALIEFGTTVVPLNTRLPQQQIAHVLQRLQPHHIFTQPGFCNILPSANKRHILEAFIENALLPNHSPEKFQSYDFSNPATMIFTSGSAGEPKITVHSYANHFFSAVGSQKNIPLDENCRWFLALPMYHVGGLAIGFRAFLAGAAVVIPEQGTDFVNSVGTEKFTHISLVPTQLRRLLAHDGARSVLKKCRAVLLGGSAIDDKLLETTLQAGLAVHTSYGSTEMSSQICTTTSGAGLSELKTSGKVLPEREVTISSENEILVRGKTLFCGYFENGKIQSPVDDAGYFKSGDLGYFDAEQNLVITGRRDNLIISGGENIQPEEIEKALSQIDEIEQAIVTAVPDSEFGQRPVAFIKWQGSEKPVAELRRLLAGKIARFKIPDQFYAWPDDAKMDKGLKVDRKFFTRRAVALHLEPTGKQ